MCDDGYESPQVQVEEWVRARKQRECYACRRPIEPGAVYHRYKSLFDGEWSTTTHCSTCWTIVERVSARSRAVVDLSLNCGVTWRDAFGREPPDVALLAFETAAEAQVRAAAEYDEQQRVRTAARHRRRARAAS